MDEFFWNKTVENVLESHAEGISKLEDSELKRILSLYRTARQTVRDRLDSMQGGTFTAQKLSGVLVQIDSGIYQMNQMLTGEMKRAGVSGAEMGVEHLVEEIKKFERVFSGAVTPISINAVRIASDTSNFLFNKYETSISAYSEQLRSIFAQHLSQAAIEEVSMGDVVSRVSQYFFGEEWRLHRLIRTEMMGVYSFGKLSGMKDIQKNDLPDLKKTLYHPMDKRTGKDSVMLQKNNPVVPVDEPFVEYSTGKKLTYMAPPNRPNDRSILIPYREVWGNG